MSRYLVNLYNHTEGGVRSLEDVCAIVAAQLRHLGHEVKYATAGVNGFLDPKDGYTIVVECFNEEAVEVLARAKKHGAKIIILATEEPTDRGFNHGVTPEMVDRQKVFPLAAKQADAILSLVPGAENWYGRFLPAAHIELGYAPSLCRPTEGTVDHDFGFYGTMTRRRLRIVQKIMRRGAAVRAISTMPPADYRDQEMRRARVILQLRVHNKMGLVSSSRCATALHFGRPVVAEPHELSDYWRDIIHFSKSESSLVEEAFMVRSLWKQFYEKQMAQFRKIMSPERCIGEPLARLGIG